jgi:GT2 family glycosyltransferase
MYSDDIDLSYRILKLEIHYYFHETTVIHYKGESTIKDETYMQHFQEAMNFFIKKHFSVPFVFSFFMKIGIVIFSLIKNDSRKTKNKIAPKSYLLYSANEKLVENPFSFAKSCFMI